MGEHWKASKTVSIVGGTHHTTVIVFMAQAVLWCLGVVALFSACSTERPLSVPQVTHAKVALAELDPGTILITVRTQMAVVSVDRPDNRMESASEGAGDAIRSVLNTPNLGHPQLEAAVGVLEIAAVPFAGAYGAVSASLARVPPDKLAEVEHNLVGAIPKLSTGSADPRIHWSFP
jgi:hypothetical protein